MQILFCSDPGIVRVLYLIKVILNIIRFTLPIGLILMISIDLYKNMINGYSNNKETIIKKSGNRILACIIVFLTPTLINILFAFISKVGFDTSSNTSFATCYTEASRDLIKTLDKQRKLKLSEKEEEKRKETTTYLANLKAEKKAIIERNNISYETSDYFSNITDLNKQNNVYIENGTFYIPKFIEGNIDTYSGRDCPSNQINNTYNNEYGFNNYFYTMLSSLIKGAKNAGYNLSFQNEGCRSYDTQYTFYFDTFKDQKGRAAVPGSSRHGFGIAADLIFYKNSSEICENYRTRANCPGMAWVHDNAKDYGLHFPLLNSKIYKEDWHTEPINLVRY